MPWITAGRIPTSTCSRRARRGSSPAVAFRGPKPAPVMRGWPCISSSRACARMLQLPRAGDRRGGRRGARHRAAVARRALPVARHLDPRGVLVRRTSRCIGFPCAVRAPRDRPGRERLSQAGTRQGAGSRPRVRPPRLGSAPASTRRVRAIPAHGRPRPATRRHRHRPCRRGSTSNRRWPASTAARSSTAPGNWSRTSGNRRRRRPRGRQPAGLPVIAVRGADDAIRVFHNVCRHRAGPIAQCDGLGAKALRCRYHGWTYTLEGQLRSAPE